MKRSKVWPDESLLSINRSNKPCALVLMHSDFRNKIESRRYSNKGFKVTTLLLPKENEDFNSFCYRIERGFNFANWLISTHLNAPFDQPPRNHTVDNAFFGNRPSIKLVAMEANYSKPGGDPNYALINWVKRVIKPEILVLYSAREETITLCKQRYGKTVQGIYIGGKDPFKELFDTFDNDEYPPPQSRRHSF